METKDRLIKKIFLMIALFVILTMIATLFFKGQLNEFAIHSDLYEWEKKNLSFFDVFRNNIVVCFVALSGIFLFRIPAFLVYFINPIMLGLILAANWVSTGVLLYFIRIIIPHSIFEIPAIVLSCSLGMQGKKGRQDIKKNTGVIYIGVIIILLVIAAFIETTVSESLI